MSGGTRIGEVARTRRRRLRRLVVVFALFVYAAAMVVVPAAAVDYSIVPGGPPVTVTVGTAGDVANVTFDGTAGQRVSLEMTAVTIGTSACCSTKVTLVRPDGRTVATSTVGTNGGFMDTQALPLTGVYTIVVDPQSTNTGSMTLTLYDVPADVTGTISPGGAPVGVSVGTPGQNARLTFTGAAGQRISLAIADVTVGTTSCCTTKVTLVKPDGKVQVTTTVGTTGGFLDTQALATTGTYAVVVDPQGVNAGGLTLTLFDVPADAAGTIVAGGSPVTIGTDTPGQNARVTFGGTAGQRVSLAVTDVTVGTTSCCTTKVTLVKPDGKVQVTTTVGTTGGFLDTQVLATTGTYALLVDPQNAATGSVTLTLYDVPADLTGTIVAGGAGVTVAPTTPGQNASLTFTGTSGQRVSLEVGPTCCSTKITIVKPNGAALASASFGMAGGFFDATTLTASGTHTVVVDLQGVATGAVTVRLYDVPADASAAAVAGGSAVTVGTTTPGQNARVTFDGTAGQRISIKVAPSCCSGKVSLLRPNGTTVVSGTFGTFSGFVDVASLPVSGTFTILLDVLGPATGSMTVTVYDVPADVTTGIAADGTPVAVTTTTPGQNARLTFAGTTGQRVFLKIGPTCCSTRVSILRPDGNALVSPVFVGVSGGFVDTQTLPTTGTYTVVVDYQGTETGSVSVTLFGVPADVTGTIVVDGAPLTVAIGAPGQNARVAFDGVAGQRVSLQMSNVTFGTISFMGARVSILNPDGTVLVTPVTVGTSGGLIDTVTLPVTGAYTIVVDPQDANTGSMTLRLYEVPSDVTTTIVAGGAPVTVTIGTPGQNARVTFAGTAGQRVSLALTGVTIGTSSCCSVRVSMIEPSGATLIFPVTVGTSGGFVDTVTLTETGTYTIFVDPQGPDTGNITLTLHDVPGDAVVTAVPGGAAATVTTTTPGQNARVSFAGTAGQRVSVKIGPICCISRVSVLNPDGTPLVPATSFGTGGGFIDTATLPVDGTYEVFIDPFGAVSGSVTITVYNVPADVTGTATFGPTTTVTTTTPGQNALVTFVGTGGDGVRLNLGPFNCCSTVVTVRDSGGTIIAGPTAFNPDGGFMFMRLPVSGTYTILVDPQGVNVGSVHLRLEVDNTAPTPPVLTLTEFSNDSHIIGATFFYRPTGAGGSFTVGATSSDAGGLSKVNFPGLAGGLTPTSAIDDLASPYSQVYSWTPGATYSNPSNLVVAFDRVGNTSATPFGVVRDPDPPVTSDNTAAIGSNWKNVNVTVNLTALDGSGSGSARTHFTTDGSTPTDTSPIGTAVILSADGVYTVKYFSVDNVFNVETVQTAGTQVRIDKTPPSAATLDPLPSVIKNGQILTGSGADALSGVASITYLYCAGSACTPSTSIGSSTTAPTYPYTWNSQPADGVYQVLARVADAAGNMLSSAKRTVTIDNTAPNTTITSAPANPTNQTSASFAFTSTEAGSTFECRLDGGPWSSCTTPHLYSGLAEGSHTFDVRATDPIGNTDATPATRTWTVDVTSPQTTITVSPSDPSSGSVSFSFTSSESGSTFQCRIDGAAFAACTSPRAYTGLADGAHTFDVRATDPAGNVDPTPATYTWTVDATPPETTITSAPTSPTNQTSATFSFTSSEAGSTFQCKLDAGAFASCTSPRTYTALADGSHTVQVRAIDPVGNTDTTPASHTWTIDTGPPNTSITSAPANPTNQTSASFSFTSTEAGSTLECRLDGSAFASCTTPSSYSSLAEGSHTFEVRATDPAGNTDPTPATFTWTVDTTAPETAITAAPANPINQTSASFSFTSTESGSSFQCSLDGSAFAACTSPKPYSGLPAGSHTFEVRATDPAGNTDPAPASYTWVVDTAAPQTTIDSSPASPTNATSATFTFSASDPGSTFACHLDGSAYAPCTSPTTYTGLGDGSHTFEVRATDPAGNTDPTPASHTWTIDTGPPNTSITSTPANPTNQTSASFSFTSTEAGSTFECRLDAGTFASCTSPSSYSSLAEGSHTFEVRATDPAGNTDPTPASSTWVVDTTPPQTTITASPSDPSGPSVSFSFTASETGSTFECALDAGAFTTCTSSKAYSGLADGTHTFEVRATDPAGNTGPTPATHTWTVDGTAPDTAITSGPATPTNATTASFSFTSTEAGSAFECKLDAGAFTACTSPQAYLGLSDGSHTFHVRATDGVGNTDASPATFTWTVDTGPPNTSITASPTDPTNSTDADFSFTASEAGSSFECALDGGAFSSCPSPKSYTALADGSHTFEARATDPAGNTDGTPASYTWTIDATPPQTTITASPSDPSGPSVSFSFTASEPGSTFECAIDAGAFTACTSSKTYTGLADGSHTFEVKATDALGNSDSSPASFTWVVDATPPNTTVDSTPSDPTNVTGATFTFSSSEAGSTFECRLDGAAFAGCTSPETYTGLADGSHTFDVRATDGVGNTDASPATFTWTVDTAAPSTSITDGPADPTNETTASFSFTSSEPGSTFECAVDGGAFASCPSPKSYTGQADGLHTFEVRATDPAGNTDQTPASYSWTVDTAAPQTTITTGPADPTNATSASVFFTASEAGSTFECSLDGGPFAGCSSPTSYSGLAAGGHTFAVEATDSLGNTDPTPATWTWTIDTTPPDTTVDSGPPDPTNATSATFTFSSSETGSGFACRVDAGAFTACSSPQEYTGLAPGTHTFEVRATDQAGNTDASPASYAWVIDVAAPETAIASGPSGATSQTSATFTFSANEAGSSFECSLDAGVFGSCTSGVTYSSLAEGLHTFDVRATDPAGNTDLTPASRTWTVDVTPPGAPAITSPADGSANNTGNVTLSGTAEAGATVEVFEGAASRGTTTAGGGGAWSKALTGVADGAHTYTAVAIDAAGNSSSASNAVTVTVDTSAPNTTITTGPLGATSSTSASFTFTADDPASTFECSLDGAPFTTCTSSKTYTGLAETSHTFQVRATDAAGNTDQSPASRGWTVDVTAPAAPVITSPADGSTNSSGSVTLAGTAEAGTFVEIFDGAASKGGSVASGGNWSKALTGVADGSHAYTAIATDAAGNASGSSNSVTVTVDATPPQTFIDSSPEDPTNSTEATFTFSSNEAGATFACRLDGGTFSSCTSPQVYTGLSETSHTFDVRATDAAGNTDSTAASFVWTVDTTAPETTIDLGPTDPTTETTATFLFSASEAGSTFECSLDAASFTVCSSPEAYSGLAAGSHTFEVKANDPAGNFESTPATYAWNVT